MATSFLPAIDISKYASSQVGLSAKALSFIGSVYAIATPDNLDDTFSYLQETFANFRTYLDVTLIESLDDVVSLLDAGAAKVFVSREQLLALKTTDNLDLSRVVLSLAGQADQELDILQDTPVGIYLHGIQDPFLVEGLLQQYGSKRPPVYVSLASASEEHAIQLARIHATPIVPATQLTVDAANQPGLISTASLMLANATSDRPDTLIPTVVTDERGVALGLVYSSPESVSESLRTGTGVYMSRKRGLWYKGATSGDVQELIKIELDCDHDCLRFSVKQEGKGESAKRFFEFPPPQPPFPPPPLVAIPLFCIIRCSQTPDKLLTVSRPAQTQLTSLSRLLPPLRAVVLWRRPVQRSQQTRGDPLVTQALRPRGLVHGASVQRLEAAPGQDPRGGQRALRSPDAEGDCL